MKKTLVKHKNMHLLYIIEGQKYNMIYLQVVLKNLITYFYQLSNRLYKFYQKIIMILNN